MKYIDEVDIKGKTLFIRVDFNVPLDQNLNITDDTRIRAVLPTIHFCLEADAKVILASHMGRPKGQPDGRILPGAGGPAPGLPAAQAGGAGPGLRRARRWTG